VTKQVVAGKVTLVTGASRGLGQAVARMFASHGAATIAVAEVASELDQTAQIAAADGAPLATRCLDLADDQAVHDLIAEVVREYGRIDVLVNAAAQLPVAPFEETTPDVWDRTVDVNLRAPYLTSFLVYPLMKAQGSGSIVNVSSRAGYRPFADETAYCATKYAVEGFSYALAAEARAHNIAVNAITPSNEAAPIKLKPTGLTQAAYDALSPAEQARYLDPMLLGEAFVFLGLQDSSGVTGHRVYAWSLSERIRREGWRPRIDDAVATRFEEAAYL
jgi:NAD(P)-dependent dehydrogenase (short-subunit alcohol dehydrogenase family)